MTSAVEHKHCSIENTTVIIMAARENSSSSEEILSDENSSNECHLYDSDVGEVSETGVDVHFALSHAEFGVICSLNQTKKTAKARRIVLERQTGNCLEL